MGCELSKCCRNSDNLLIREDKDRQSQVAQYRKELEIARSQADSGEQIRDLQVRCAELDSELLEKEEEILHLKTGASLSNRSSLKLNRKYATQEGPSLELALKEAKAWGMVLEDENGRLKSQLQEQESQKAVRKDSFVDLQLELEELKSDLNKLSAYNLKLLEEKVLLMLCSSMNINMLLALNVWKTWTAAKVRLSVFSTASESNSESVDRQELLQSSPYYPSLGKSDFSNVRFMSRTSLHLLIENVIDEKYDQDLRDREAGRRPRPMTEFLIEYMNRRHGLPAMATQKLAQFVLGLISMYTTGNQYAKVMCGVFNIIKQDSMHATLSMFLVHVRAVFQGLREKRGSGLSRPRSVSSATPASDYRKEKFEHIDSGGSASLVCVCDFIYSIFRDFPASGEMMLRLIKPPDLSIEDFIFFKICHKMAQEGCSPEDLFKRLDRDHGGTIDRDEFNQGIKQLMSLWLSDEDLKLAMEKMAQGAVEVPKEQFFKYINFDAYYNSSAWKNLNVTLVQFLLSLMSLHQSIVKECGEAFHEVSHSDQIEPMDFQRGLIRFDSTLTPADSLRIYNSATIEKLDLRTFADICQNELIGRFRSFNIANLEAERKRLNTPRTDVDTPKSRDKRRGVTFKS